MELLLFFLGGLPATTGLKEGTKLPRLSISPDPDLFLTEIALL
jgi:hypothetical protein